MDDNGTWFEEGEMANAYQIEICRLQEENATLKKRVEELGKLLVRSDELDWKQRAEKAEERMEELENRIEEIKNNATAQAKELCEDGITSRNEMRERAEKAEESVAEWKRAYTLERCRSETLEEKYEKLREAVEKHREYKLTATFEHELLPSDRELYQVLDKLLGIPTQYPQQKRKEDHG